MTSTNDRIILDIDTIPEAAKINKAHALMQLHGPQCKDKEIIKNYLNKLTSIKKQVREFAADAIKVIMVDEAKQLSLTCKVGSKNILVSKYCDIKKQITDNVGYDPDFYDKFVDVVYTWAEYPNREWDERIEEEFMTPNHQVYKEEETRFNQEGEAYINQHQPKAWKQQNIKGICGKRYIQCQDTVS